MTMKQQLRSRIYGNRRADKRFAPAEMIYAASVAELDAQTPGWDFESRVEGAMERLREGVESAYAAALSIYGEKVVASARDRLPPKVESGVITVRLRKQVSSVKGDVVLVEDRAAGAAEHVRAIAKQIREAARGESPSKLRVRRWAQGDRVTVSYAITDPDSGTPSESHFTGSVYAVRVIAGRATVIWVRGKGGSGNLINRKVVLSDPEIKVKQYAFGRFVSRRSRLHVNIEQHPLQDKSLRRRA